jgi:hypothetical protein
MEKPIIKTIILVFLAACSGGRPAGEYSEARRYFIGYARGGITLYYGDTPRDIVVPMFAKEQGAWQTVKEYPPNHGDSGKINWGFTVNESDKILAGLGLEKPKTLPEADEVATDSAWDKEAVPRFVVAWPEVRHSKIAMRKKSEIDEGFEAFWADDKEVKDIRKTFETKALPEGWDVSRLKLAYAQTVYSVDGDEKFAVLRITLETGNMPEAYEIVLEKSADGWRKLFASNHIPAHDSKEIRFKLKFAGDVDGDGKTDYIFALNGYNFDGFMLYNADSPPVIFGWGYH